MNQFLHHRLVDLETAGGVQNDCVKAVLFGVVDGVLGNLYRVLGAVLFVNRHVNLLAKHAKLLDGGRTNQVAGGKEGAASVFF